MSRDSRQTAPDQRRQELHGADIENHPLPERRENDAAPIAAARS